QWSPLSTTYAYDSNTNLFSSMDRGLGTTLSLAPAASQGLATSPAKNANQALAVITDPLSQLTTYTMDGISRATKLQTPDGGTQSWVLDQAGQPISYTDPLNRVTSGQYQYGSGTGDSKSFRMPSTTTEQFQYDGTFHNVTQSQ